MKTFLWNLFARIVRFFADALIAHARKTPYTHLEGYMERFWLFNAYNKNEDADWERAPFPWLPSIRIHHILRGDLDQHLHDHPWNARTVVLKGWYVEERILTPRENISLVRLAGDTASITFGEYHRILAVNPGGVWTLWITWKYQGRWGFWCNGRKVFWKDYLRGVR